MLDIRPLLWMTDPREHDRARISGAIADWLHNLAQFSYLDFRDFDEHQFWREYCSLVERFPNAAFEHYKTQFERESGQPLGHWFTQP